jgi:4-amino-4-deoxy-L-arabinose transferase-like glycosyltransferase
MKIKYEYILLFIILIAGACLRFYNLGEISFSNDELSALTRARFGSFSELVEKGIKVDGHPALVQTIIWLTVHHINDEVFTIRFLFALSGVISIFLIFLLGKRWFGTAAGLLSAAAMAGLQFPLLYSQTARPYAIGLMFSLAFAYCWTRLLFDSQKKLWIITAYVAAGIGCVYTHYFSMMLAGIIGASGLFFTEKKIIKKYLFANALIVLSFLPAISVFRQQFGYEGIGGWLPAPDHFFSFQISV